MAPTYAEGDDRFGLGGLSTLGADVKVWCMACLEAIWTGGASVQDIFCFTFLIFFRFPDFKCIVLCEKF